MLQKIVSQLQAIGDPSNLIPTVSAKLAEAKAKLTSELPLVEQLAAATEAHTQAQTALAMRTSQAFLAQRFYQEAQQRKASAEAQLANAKAALDSLNAAASREAAAKQAPNPPVWMSLPSLQKL